MSTWWKSTDEAISSLHAATAQIQHDAARCSATLAQLHHNTATTNTTLHSCQIYLRAILLQLAQLQPSSAPPSPTPAPSGPSSDSQFSHPPSFSSTLLHDTLSAPIRLANPTSTLIHPHIPKAKTQIPTQNTQNPLPQISTASPYFSPLCIDAPICLANPSPPPFSSPSILKPPTSFMPQPQLLGFKLPQPLPGEFSLLKPSSTHQIVGLPAPLEAKLLTQSRLSPSFSSPSLPKQITSFTPQPTLSLFKLLHPPQFRFPQLASQTSPPPPFVFRASP